MIAHRAASRFALGTTDEPRNNPADPVPTYWNLLPSKTQNTYSSRIEHLPPYLPRMTDSIPSRAQRFAAGLSLLFCLLPSQATWVGPFPTGVPGSGYGCDNPCNDGDVNYVIEASLQTYTVPGSKMAPSIANGKDDLSMFTRTFTGGADSKSAFCKDYDGTTGPLGPCITVNPGQQMKIKLVNNMDHGTSLLHQSPTTIDQYWKLASTPGQPDLDAIQFYGTAPKTPQEMRVDNEQNIPGQDATYDDANLHFHGLQIVPHLFYPLGTGDPQAPWITTTPSSENPDQQCFCYVIDVPDDQPQGTYWYHVHRHGAATMQAWQGMVGYLLVGNSTTPGSPDHDLAQQGVTRDELVALWEWAVDENNTVAGDLNTLTEPNFLDSDREQIFLTNNDFAPSLTMCVNETVHLRLLCAQTTTGSALYILDGNDDVTPFWVFASDGISYNQSYEMKALVIGPGQREGVLVQFQKPGFYRLMQTTFNDFQGEGVDLSSPLPATYFVVSENCTSPNPPVDVASLVFTPGIAYNVEPDTINRQVDVNFDVQSVLDRAPVPQFLINGEFFDYRNSFDTIEEGTSQQWTLTSNMNCTFDCQIRLTVNALAC